MVENYDADLASGFIGVIVPDYRTGVEAALGECPAIGRGTGAYIGSLCDRSLSRLSSAPTNDLGRSPLVVIPHLLEDDTAAFI